MKATLSFATLLGLAPAVFAANFTLLQDYSGSKFFDRWTFIDNFDNTTNGDIQYISPSTNSNASQLAFVNGAGNAIIKVDNTSFVPYNEKRDSIRIESQDFYEVGSVWVFDAIHLPYGCSVWPSFWSKGFDWPRQGEIDIVEGINLMSANQMALHTFAGCTASGGSGAMTGALGDTNCNSTTGSGCTVGEKTGNSFGQGFAAGGGGVWATQFDTSGIYIWYWPRANVPASVSTATDSIDISAWGTPSAAFPAAGCNIPEFFGPQQFVLDITLCGDWAGVPSLYQPTCGGDGSAQGCYVNSVINAGSPNMDNAYFEIRSIKTYGVNSSVVATGTNAASPNPTSNGGGGGSSSNSSGGGQSGGAEGIMGLTRNAVVGVIVAGAAAVFGGLAL
ncbi:hypothetical protein EIP91_009772 [Steccherinum ochraceum]|uniref:GH16 domain-containing protein n=1 Tax=Steccherinum ochraceum TaxID=92696 RepID=A0A4R0R3H4_9APHY|nr:hypothetical protein EIP91_009772 [Steccherinum ochraceum]